MFTGAESEKIERKKGDGEVIVQVDNGAWNERGGEYRVQGAEYRVEYQTPIAGIPHV